VARGRHWKVRSSKKMSARERGVFVDKKPCSLGLDFSKKKGFCTFSNDVLCSHPKNPNSFLTDWCLACPDYKRIMQEMEDEDLEMDAEIEEMHRTGVYK
jgi:hypothetical protein